MKGLAWEGKMYSKVVVRGGERGVKEGKTDESLTFASSMKFFSKHSVSDHVNFGLKLLSQF